VNYKSPRVRRPLSGRVTLFCPDRLCHGHGGRTLGSFLSWQPNCFLLPVFWPDSQFPPSFLTVPYMPTFPCVCDIPHLSQAHTHPHIHLDLHFSATRPGHTWWWQCKTVSSNHRLETLPTPSGESLQSTDRESLLGQIGSDRYQIVQHASN
jgi:hypothetical protein